MRIAPTGLKPDEHHVVYPGEKRDTPAKNVEAVPLSQRVKAT